MAAIIASIVTKVTGSIVTSTSLKVNISFHRFIA